MGGDVPQGYDGSTPGVEADAGVRVARVVDRRERRLERDAEVVPGLHVGNAKGVGLHHRRERLGNVPVDAAHIAELQRQVNRFSDAKSPPVPVTGVLDEATGKPLYWVWDGAEKTYGDFKLEVTNPGGHSSAPRPDNAINNMARAALAVASEAVSVWT